MAETNRKIKALEVGVKLSSAQSSVVAVIKQCYAGEQRLKTAARDAPRAAAQQFTAAARNLRATGAALDAMLTRWVITEQSQSRGRRR